MCSKISVFSCLPESKTFRNPSALRLSSNFDTGCFSSKSWLNCTQVGIGDVDVSESSNELENFEKFVKGGGVGGGSG